MCRSVIATVAVILLILPSFAFAETSATKKQNGIKAVMKTTKGTIHLKLHADKVPLTVANFVNLVNRGFYNGLKFHRVIPNFMVQTGCPFGTGYGGPGYRFEDEIDTSLGHYGPGILSMANSGPNTNGSQIFITHTSTPWLNGKHAVFGAVESEADMTVVNKIEAGDQIITVSITGDTTALLAANKKRIDEWNTVLDKKFPTEIRLYTD